MSIIKGLNIGRNALMTHTESMKIIGQNISNVNVPGNSRQRLELENTFYSGDDSIQVLTARRIRDTFIDQRIRSENQALGNWEMQAIFYSTIEETFLEPSENDLNNTMAEFWNNWEDLANYPENLSARSMIVQSGELLATTLNHIDSQLRDVRSMADDYIRDRVTQINDMASRIADINSRIVSIEASGEEASKIRDSRDMLIQQMSKIVSLKSVENENGQVTLSIGGRAIVDGKEFMPLEIQQHPDDGMLISDIVWSNDKSDVKIKGGEIEGLKIIRDEAIPDILTNLDRLASDIIGAVNDIHKTGFGLDGSTGLSFFTGISASDIGVNSEIADDVNKVAASGSSEAGDNTIALAIAELADKKIAPGETDIGTFYSNIINTVGNQSRNASIMQDNSSMFVKYMEEQRESVSGVSLDEEMANMIESQRAYESAAKYISVLDELIGVLMDMA